MSLSGIDTGPACISTDCAGLRRCNFCFISQRLVSKLGRCRFCYFGYRVVPKFPRQRLAPQQPLEPHPRPPQHAKPLDRLIRIPRASRLEPATPRKQYRQVHLINTQRRQRRFHRNGLPLHRRRRWGRLPSVSFHFSHFSSTRRLHHHTHTLFIKRTKSPANTANSARPTLLFG